MFNVLLQTKAYEHLGLFLCLCLHIVYFLRIDANLLGSLQPPNAKEFIDRVIKCPLHDIAIPLSGFRWEYNKVIGFHLALCLSTSILVIAPAKPVLWVSGKLSSLEAFVFTF